MYFTENVLLFKLMIIENTDILQWIIKYFGQYLLFGTLKSTYYTAGSYLLLIGVNHDLEL